MKWIMKPHEAYVKRTSKMNEHRNGNRHSIANFIAMVALMMFGKATANRKWIELLEKVRNILENPTMVIVKTVVAIEMQ